MTDEKDEKKAQDVSPQSLGGSARAESLSPEERTEIAAKAARARWGTDIPRATHSGKLTIGEMVFPCSVLSDGTRILTQSDFMAGMNMYYSGWIAKNKAKNESTAEIPHFLAFKSIEPFISKHLGDLQSVVVRYRTEKGSLAQGIKAVIIPKICEVWLDANEAGKLPKRQKQIAERAKVLMRALAHVAIEALVDEATGYQAIRERDALQKLLALYVNEELLPWTRRFPDEFYRQMFRLRNWHFSPTNKGPRYAGKLTNELIYERLPPGVLDELRRKNPRNEKGQRRHRHHQLLTEDIGNPHLEKQVASVTTLMRASPNWSFFKRLFIRAFPRQSGQTDWIEELGGIDDDES
ncbi:MAG: P63C domain-containing protein [Candidatus Sumerlaeia bacterium]